MRADGGGERCNPTLGTPRHLTGKSHSVEYLGTSKPEPSASPRRDWQWKSSPTKYSERQRGCRQGKYRHHEG
jgi:hypothetical protein